MDWWTDGWMVNFTTTHSEELSLHALRGVLGFGTGLTGSSSLLTSTSGGAEKQKVHMSQLHLPWLQGYNMTFIGISSLKILDRITNLQTGRGWITGRSTGMGVGGCI